MKKYRILVIDDETDILSLLEGVLGEDYEVITMSNPLKALENLDEIEADIFIVDIMMPEMGGRDVVKQIRQNPHFKQSLVIFLSVITDRQVIIETFQCGGDLYLNKPFTPGRFLDSIRSLLSRRVL
ncbi:MAG TPA: response regulator, partial [Candidatus Sumerlaeota bacterium]|nr:response regulator [Candidatus Sumerlaeota bacterium]